MSSTDWPQQGPPGPPPGRIRLPYPLKLALTVCILAALGWLILTATQYCRSGKPLSELPSVPGPVAGMFNTPAQFAGALEGVQRPLGVAVAPDGKIYVSESAGERKVHVFDKSGSELFAFAPPGEDPTSRVPLYVAVSPSGQVYVSDRHAQTINVYSASGELVSAFEPEGVPAEQWHPMGLAFDQEGNLYVTDVSDGQHRVMVFDPQGKLRLQFGSEGVEKGQFWYPNGIAVDKKGRIYVADSNNGRVQVFDKDGNLLYVIPRGYAAGDLAMPRGLALDDKGHLFVADTTAHVVKVYDVSGDRPSYVTDFGGPGRGDGEFRFPNGVAVVDNQIYVTDRENGRVQIWTY